MTLSPEAISVNEDERLIPNWSIAVATLSFVAMEIYLWLILPYHASASRTDPPMGFRIYFNLSWGVLIALYFLMVGYISQDAPRRSMSKRFWMMLCFVMPAGIGAVLYFLLRAPEVSRCLACSAQVQSDFHFCPQCNYQLTASCGKCYRTVRTTDRFCTRCGHELAEDQLPARLHILGS